MPSPIHSSERTAVFESIVEERRSTRHFQNRPIPEGTIQRILEIATHAPSGYNLQPWRFIVVKDPETKRKLRAVAYGQAQCEEAAAVLICCGHTTAWKQDIVPIYEKAIALGASSETYFENVKKYSSAYLGHQDMRSWCFKQLGLVCAHVLIAAQAMGLDSGPMEGFDEPALKKAFGIPDDVVVAMLIVLGYGAVPGPPFPGRMPVSKVTFGETWGGSFGG